MEREKIIYLTRYNLTLKEVEQIFYEDPELKRISKKKAQMYSASLPCEAITIFEEGYPQKLKELDNPPLVIFYLGNLKLLDKSLSLVTGTNYPSDYGKKATRELVNLTTEVLMSGFMYGIDTVVQQEVIKLEKESVVLLASGFEEVYPPNNLKYIKEISKKGLVFSLLPTATKATIESFAERNSVLAYLASKVYIMEAQKESYPLHIVDYALDFGKEIYALPGSIYNQNSEGTNYLIGEGANILYLQNKKQ